jgi:hypothetical protein
MTSALLIDLWFTITGAAALVMTAAHLAVTIVQLTRKS